MASFFQGACRAPLAEGSRTADYFAVHRSSVKARIVHDRVEYHKVLVCDDHCKTQENTIAPGRRASESRCRVRKFFGVDGRGLLRHSKFVGLREDKDARTAIKERAS